MRTLLVRTPSLVLGSLSIMLLAGMCLFFEPGSRWPLGWIGIEVALLWLRLHLLRVARPRIESGSTASFYGYVAAAIGWCAIVGIGACVCVLSGNPVLIALAAINVSGVAAGISTRSAAFPRLAIAQILLVGMPFAVGAAFTPIRGFAILALEIPMCMAAMASLALTHHRDSVKVIRAERENRLLALHDSLTGLPNRQNVLDRLELHCAELRSRGPDNAEPFALMCVDLDGFKIINDTLGHPAGDRLLVAVAHGLRDAVRSPDIVARIGGDEFVVLLPGAQRDEAAAVARRIVARLREPISVGDGEPITVDSTVGIAFGPADGVTADMLLSRADQALYAAKRAGGGRYCIYGQSAAGQSPSALS